LPAPSSPSTVMSLPRATRTRPYRPLACPVMPVPLELDDHPHAAAVLGSALRRPGRAPVARLPVRRPGRNGQARGGPGLRGRAARRERPGPRVRARAHLVGRPSRPHVGDSERGARDAAPDVDDAVVSAATRTPLNQSVGCSFSSGPRP
jgi:hypothetical protein